MPPSPADDDHAFGHTSAEDLAALAQAVFILVSALVIGWAAVGAAAGAETPPQLADEGLGMAVMAVSIAADAGAGLVAGPRRTGAPAAG